MLKGHGNGDHGCRSGRWVGGVRICGNGILESLVGRGVDVLEEFGFSHDGSRACFLEESGEKQSRNFKKFQGLVRYDGHVVLNIWWAEECHVAKNSDFVLWR